jgi:outer membrane protein assembly factor BamB
VTIEGVELRLVERVPAGTSGRGWPGNRCSFELALASGAGRPVRLLADQAPPFNAVTSLVRSGGAVWLELSFNGYTREFPKGGNRVVAVDLCEGKIAWTSRDSWSNGGLLLLGDYLVTAYGFTSERRYLHVLDARSGKLVQRLPVVENICPSKSWAPNYDGGRCDAPGQRVGAAKNPRVEDGLLLVDTNTGSAAFQFE